MTILILCVGAWQVMNRPDFTIGMLVAFQMFSGRVSQPMLRIVGLWQNFQQTQIAVRRLADIMNAPVEPYSVVPQTQSDARGEIEFRDVSFRYREDLPFLYQGLNLRIPTGECAVLMGPSGCGKSTLMNIIAGLDEPSGGVMRLQGRDITGVAPADRNISMVFQSYALYPNMTVAKNIEFPLEMRKVDKTQRRERVQSVAKLLQIEHLLDRKPRQLSGGQRQRVAIGRALAREPQLYLLDEPLSNLDAQLRVDMRTEIKKLHQRLNATIVYVTHDQIEAMTLATRIAVMKGGVLQQLGTPHEVYNKPANTFVAGFMGSPRMNLVKARIASQGEGLALRIDGKGGAHLQIDLPIGLLPVSTMAVRPKPLRDISSKPC